MNDKLKSLSRQQSALAEFGEMANSAYALDKVLNTAAIMASETLGVSHVKVLEWRPEAEDLLVRAGVGWSEGVVGNAAIGADLESPAGFALKSGQPTVSNDLAKEERFRIPKLLTDHGVKSAANAIIRSGEQAFGVFEADSRTLRSFSEADIRFLQGAANLLGLAIDRHRLSEANAELVQHKEVLLREIQHRVKNNAQTLISLMNLQLTRSQFGETHTALRSLMTRVQALSMLESHLYLDPDIERIDLAIYVMELLGKLVSFHSDSVEQIRLDTNLTQVHVTPSQAEALGLVTNEFVMNSFKHAFSQSGGTLRVELSHDDKTAIFTIADDGPGFEQGVGEEGLGLRLMTAFVKQIGAELELIGDSGTRLTITWPLK
ncbi:MAG: hypothetical protein CMM50_11325 [Rhodospirillaceae bacterium]|nr:hypothetical protein [Rhodospirillaceae bacterium]